MKNTKNLYSYEYNKLTSLQVFRILENGDIILRMSKGKKIALFSIDKTLYNELF